MNQREKKEKERMLSIGKMLFEQGLGEEEFMVFDGYEKKISLWDPVCLNISEISRMLNNDLAVDFKEAAKPNKYDTIARCVKKGEMRGVFEIRKRKELNNADEVSLTSLGVCWLFVNGRIELTEFARFLDEEEMTEMMFDLIEKEKKGIDKYQRERVIWKEAGWSDDEIENAIELLKEAIKRPMYFPIIASLNAEDRKKLEKDLKKIAKSILTLESNAQVKEELALEIFPNFILSNLRYEAVKAGRSPLLKVSYVSPTPLLTL